MVFVVVVCCSEERHGGRREGLSLSDHCRRRGCPMHQERDGCHCRGVVFKGLSRGCPQGVGIVVVAVHRGQEHDGHRRRGTESFVIAGTSEVFVFAATAQQGTVLQDDSGTGKTE